MCVIYLTVHKDFLTKQMSKFPLANECCTCHGLRSQNHCMLGIRSWQVTLPRHYPSEGLFYVLKFCVLKFYVLLITLLPSSYATRPPLPGEDFSFHCLIQIAFFPEILKIFFSSSLETSKRQTLNSLIPTILWETKLSPFKTKHLTGEDEMQPLRLSNHNQLHKFLLACPKLYHKVYI